MRAILPNIIVCFTLIGGYGVLLSRAVATKQIKPAIADAAYLDSTPGPTILKLELGKDGELSHWHVGNLLFYVNIWGFDMLPAGDSIRFGVKTTAEGIVEITWPEDTVSSKPKTVWLYLSDDARGLRNILIRSAEDQVIADKLSPGRWVALTISAKERTERKLRLSLWPLTGDDVWLKAVIITSEGEV